MKKISGLNGLRVYAVYSVVLYHCNDCYPLPAPWNGIVYTNGYLGLMISFLISGFLIGYLNGEKWQTYQVQDSISFWKKKILKFYPLHLMVFLFFLIQKVYEYHYGVESGTVLYDAVRALPNLLLLHSLVPDSSFSFSFNVVSWYLSCLMFIYLAAPLCICWLKKLHSSNDRVLLGMGLIIARTILMFLTAGYSQYFWLWNICPLTRAVDVVLGMIAGLYFREHEKGNGPVFSAIRWKCVAFWVVEVLLLFLSLCMGQGNHNVGTGINLSILCIIGMLLMVLALRENWFSALLSTRVLEAASSFSFEVYMTHSIAAVITMRIFAYGQSLRLPIAVCLMTLSVVVGWLSHQFLKSKQYQGMMAKIFSAVS